MYLTVGQASGLIALAVLIVQFFLPLAIVLVLLYSTSGTVAFVGIALLQQILNARSFLASARNVLKLGPRSVIGRSVQSSWLPTLFHSDSASTRHVSRRVTFLSGLSTLCLLLLAVAGIITPLGLTEEIIADDTRAPDFQYSPDQSAFGYGTPPRYERFSRVCGLDLIPVNCPGRSEGVDRVRTVNDTIEMQDSRPDSYFNTSVPQNLSAIFSSATAGTTLSGAFDIQYRTWEVGLDTHDGDPPRIDRGSPYPRSSYRSLDSIILHNKTEALEGVIADTRRGGVGYRNHTIPTGMPLGGQWSEDLTWIEPVTECVDTNLTLEISLGTTALNITNVNLIDNGGFSNHPRKLPDVNETQDSQEPELAKKAYQGALMANALMMYYFNVSYPNNTGPRNTSLGRHFPLNSDYTPPLYSIALRRMQPDFLDYPSEPHEESLSNVSTSAQARLGVSSSDWRDVQDKCEGYITKGSTYTNAELSCGFLSGAPRPLHSDDARVFQPFSRWTQSLFVCSSGIRASVKRVKFSINGTSSLDNLQVTSVEDKVYKDDASRPLWGVENTYKGISDAKPLWGMVDSRFESSPDLFTWRAERLWLPATLIRTGITWNVDSLATPSVFGGSMADTYSGSTSSSGSTNGLLDYSGAQSMALNHLWQSLSASPSTASMIINLIFTEILATATVGTKSAIMTASDRSPSSPNHVVQYRKQLQYNMLYAIPALLILLITLMVLFVLPFCLATGFSLKAISLLLNQTSTGRLVTDYLYPDLCAPGANTRDWCRVAGHTELQLSFRGNATMRQKEQSRGENGSDGSEGTSATSYSPSGHTRHQETNMEIMFSSALNESNQHPETEI